MIFILIVSILFLILLFILKKNNFKYPLSLAIVGVVFIIICLNLLTKKGENDYEGDLVPLKNEVKNIGKYEQAVKLLLASYEKLDDEKRKKSKLFKETGREGKYYLQDSLYKVLQGSKLRFSRYDIKIDGNDTTITFESERGDFYMRGNHKDKDANYTIFWHSIVYTNKPIKEFKNEDDADDADDTPSTVIKIKDKYYYQIWSGFEY